jgi:hypothetical protein
MIMILSLEFLYIKMLTVSTRFFFVPLELSGSSRSPPMALVGLLQTVLLLVTVVISCLDFICHYNSLTLTNLLIIL